MVAAAIGGSAVAGLAGSAIAGSEQSSATNAAIGEQQNALNQAQAALSPYSSAGLGAMPQLQGITQQEQGLLPQFQGLFSQFQGLNSQQQGVATQGQGILNQASGAATQLGNMTGANGAAAQQSWINGLTSNPLYTSAMQLGQQQILANASATGGLRGGNTIATLGYLPQQTLANVMNQSISNQQSALSGYLNALGGAATQNGLLGSIGNTLSGAGAQLTNDYGVLSGLGSQFTNLINQGESAAAGVGNAALTTGSNVSNLNTQQGAIGAGATLGATNALSGAANSYISSSNLNSILSALTGSGTSSLSSLTGPGYNSALSSFAAPAYLNAAGISGANSYGFSLG